MTAGDGAAAAALAVGDPARVGPYRLLGRLGAGGTGPVYLGSSTEGRLVAVKVAAGRLALEPGFRDGLRDAVAAHQAVEADHLVPVVEVSVDGGADAEEPWVATEYLEVPSLERLIALSGPLSIDEVGELARGLAEVLAGMHEAGVIHGDLTPSRVLLTPAGPRLLDFGIVRALDSTSIDRIDLAIGDPGHLCPEELLGTGVTEASDVYALGTVLHYAATGAAPFGFGEVATAYERAASYQRIVHEEPDLAGLSDRALRALIADCLSKDPAARPTAARLSVRLKQANTVAVAEEERLSAVQAVLGVPVAPPPPAPPPAPQEPKTLRVSGQEPTTLRMSGAPRTADITAATVSIPGTPDSPGASQPSTVPAAPTVPVHDAIPSPPAPPPAQASTVAAPPRPPAPPSYAPSLPRQAGTVRRHKRVAVLAGGLALLIVAAVAVVAWQRSDSSHAPAASPPASSSPPAGPNGKAGFTWALTKREADYFIGLWSTESGVVLGTKSGLTAYDAASGAKQWSWKPPKGGLVCNMSHNTSAGLGVFTYGMWTGGSTARGHHRRQRLRRVQEEAPCDTPLDGGPVAPRAKSTHAPFRGMGTSEDGFHVLRHTYASITLEAGESGHLGALARPFQPDRHAGLLRTLHA